MAKNKKLVFVIPYLRDGGAERVTAALASEIARLPEYQVHLITYEYDPNREYPLDEKVTRHNLPDLRGNRITKIFGRLSFLRKTVRKIAPDCVISLAAIHMVALLTIALFGCGIPLVLSERNDPVKSPGTKMKRGLRFVCYSLCDGLVFQPSNARDFFPVFMRNKSVVICNPLSSGLPEPFAGIREKKIVNFCRLVPQKNLELLIDAFSDISSEHLEYTLHIYGEGPERKRLSEKIQNLSMGDRIILHGYTSNIYAEINNAAMFVSSSNYEGISNSMLEAIALGIPSVCTDCPAGGARETITNGVNGLLVPTGNRKELANAMRKVLEDSALAEAMSKSGILLRETLSVSAIAHRWLDFLKRVMT